MAAKKDDKHFEIVYSDYLPDGWTFDRLVEEIEKRRPLELTRENLAKIIDPKYLDMNEEQLLEELKKFFENKK